MVTLVYTYYNQPETLILQEALWASYATDVLQKLTLIVVDDGSTIPLATVKWPGVSLIHLRINEDLLWNQDQARNLAMRFAKGWCFLCDLDHGLPPAAAAELTQTQFKLGSWYKPWRTHRGVSLNPPANIYLLHADQFADLKGYPPASGYGTDRFFLRSLQSVLSHPIPLFKELPLSERLQVLSSRDASAKGDRKQPPTRLESYRPFTWCRIT
jgi:glycosyltransferase involved in cell wall biosynthesis